MSAGVCGKRLGFEEIFGSSSSPTSSSKRFRCSSFGSPIRTSSEFGFGSEDKVSFLVRMFPDMDRVLVESILNTHNHKVDDAVNSLHALSLGDVCLENGLRNPDSIATKNSDIPGVENSQLPEQRTEGLQDNNIAFECRNPTDGSSWVDVVVQEMLNASDMDDARGRAARILEIFERSVVANSRASDEQELASLKEHLQNLLRDNQILKRAVSIQHGRNLEQEEKTREVEQLKQVLNQYHEQLQTLEINNYTLKLHLQRAQETSSIPGCFHPDVF